MKRLREKWEKKDMEFLVFLLLFFVMLIYYTWRLFALTPWYDELYTYYYFISRGPVYAAIHWPLPNNHVGYSVLSAFLDFAGNAAVGLRGISWLASLISLCLLFMIGRKCFGKGFALLPVCLYATMDIVNQLAVQGRGYALSACLYLVALYELLQIVVFHENKKRRYVILAFSMIWSLYTLPSSVYFVLPLCLIGGSFLLIEKNTKEFVRLFVTAFISALCTIALYAVIWLAIGSNLLSKTPDGPCYQQGHINIILHVPFRALKTGIDYMLDTPYIQSVPREGYLQSFAAWIKTLFSYYYPGFSTGLLIVTGAGIVCIIVFLIRKITFLEWYLLLSFVLTPFMLIIQAALPYYRVFTFFGVPAALLLTWLFTQICAKIKYRKAVYAITAFIALLCMMQLCRPDYLAQYSEREAAIADACGYMDVQKDTLICVTDCDQEYLVKYLYDREDVMYEISGADYVLLDKLLLLSEEEFEKADSGDFWKFYATHDGIAWDYLEEEMEVRYENERVVLYGRK